MHRTGGGQEEVALEDPAVAAWHDGGHRGMPPGFVDATGVGPGDQLAVQAALQEHVDSAISKTVTLPADASLDAFRSIYRDAWRLGLKGATAYRQGSMRGAVLVAPGGDRGGPHEGPHCCSLDRESE
jgi:ribonucleoside-diphosphate reductase alpha chain